MKKFIMALMFALSACGGGSGGDSSSAQAPSAPVISNLSVSPLAASVGSGVDGRGTGTLSFDFTSSADLVQLNVNDSVDFGTQTAKITGYAGARSGHFTIPIAYPTTSKQLFTFTYWVTDANGNVSNKLSGMIPIGG
jgi:hypothetical protein